MKAPDAVYQPLGAVAHTIQQGDLLLFRRRGLISIAGRGAHSHAAKADWWDGDLMLLETREWFGGRAVLLEHEVARYPGVIDLYDVNPNNRWPEYNAAGAAHVMRRLTGRRYGRKAIIAASCSHLPVVRLFTHANMDDREYHRDWPPFCSQAVANADRYGGGVDPVPNLADRLTEPADLARSPFYRYRCTLVPGGAVHRYPPPRIYEPEEDECV